MNDLAGTTLLERYRVMQFVGRGGMADVYRVWDFQRSVYLAMKVLHEDLAEDEIFLRRFRREADNLSRLQHPYIIRSYGLFQTEDLAFLLMDFIDGSTLRKEIFNRKTPWTPQQIMTVMRPICAALNFAHTQGLVHCDVKPANIMLTGNHEVMLADFGIARYAESTTTATMVGAGTPAYMAPEQILGEDPKPQTDIYALGIILFEMLTGGQRPFVGDNARSTGSSSEKVRWEHINSMPPSVRIYNLEVSSEVEAIVFKCLAKEPADRFGSTMELITALGQALGVSSDDQTVDGGIPFPSPPSPPTPPTPPAPPTPLPRRPVPWWVFAGSFMAVVILAVLAFQGPQQSPPPVSGSGVTSTSTEKQTQPTTVTPTLEPSNTPPKVNTPTPRPQPTSTRPPTATPQSAIPACNSDGQTWVREKDKMTMVCITGGNFPMGFPNCNEFWCQNEANQGNVFVEAFWMDRNEVTNAQFQQFVADTGFVTGAERSGASEVFGNLQPVKGANWKSPQGPGSSISRISDNPVVQMNWFSANAYCKWAGGRLPSEAQWEKAARGTDGRLFPWGGNLPAANYLNAAGQDDGFRYTAPIDSFPDGKSPYGLYDMAGNVFEWTRSLMKSYPYNSKDGREIETEPGPDDKVVSRGGSFYTDYGTVRTTWRAETIAQRSTDGTGFRCVIDR